MAEANQASARSSIAMGVPAVLVLFLVVTSVWDPLPELGVYDGKRIIQVWLMAACLALALLDPGVRRECSGLWASTPLWIRVSLGTASILGVLSAAVHSPVAYPLAEVLILVLLLALAFAIAACRRQAGPALDKLLIGGVALLGLLVGLQEMMGFLAGWSMGDPYRFEYMTVHFAHPRFYNHLQTLSIPLLAALPWVFAARRGLKLLAIALIALQWCLLLMSGGRGSVLGLGLALLLSSVLLFRQRPGWLGIQWIGLLTGGLLFISVLAAQGVMFNQEATSHEPTLETGSASDQMASQSLGRYTSTHGSGRRQLWSEAWEQSVENPLLGIGPSRYACVAPRGMGAHPHSFPMQLLSEWGWPATLLIGLVAAWVGLRGIAGLLNPSPHPDSGAPELTQSLVVALIALAIHAGVSGVLMVPASQLAVALAGGYLLARLAPGPDPNVPPSHWSGLPLALSALLALGLAAFSQRELAWIHGAEMQQTTDTVLSPRYWQWGKVCELGR